MAKDKVYITLEVTDKGSKVVRGFDKNTEQAFNKMKNNAKASTASMGSSIDKLKKHWVAFSAAAVAGVLVLRKAITAVMAKVKEWINLSKVQELAEIGLAAALKAAGEYTDILNQRYQEFASWIQRVTKYGDEQVLGLMALIKNLGVSTDKVEKATKMAIGLAAATSRDVSSMAQYVALALQGEYTMLRRYIPALRATTDATEQMKIVTDFAARGFKVAQEMTESFSVALIQLGNLWADLKEKLGDFATRNKAIMEQLHRAKDHLIELNDKLQNWITNNQELINQKTHEVIGAIATAIRNVVAGLGALYKLKNVFKEVFSAIPGIKELQLLYKIISKITESKIEGQTGVVRMPIIKPKEELPLLEPPPSMKPEFMADYWLNLKEYSEQALHEETERMNTMIEREQETAEMLLEIKAQYYLDDAALAEERLKKEIEMMNASAEEAKRTEKMKAELFKRTSMEMVSWYASAFKELAKGSKLAFAAQKMLSIMETMMKTHEFAVKAAAWAATWGGLPAAIAAKAIAYGLGMTHVMAIQQMEPAAMYHGGGIVGRGSQRSRLVSPDVFAGAQRAHTGLAPDERPVIVRKDEGIFTPAQMAALGMGDEYYDEDRAIIQLNFILDGRVLAKSFVHRTEIDSIILNRLRKALS